MKNPSADRNAIEGSGRVARQLRVDRDRAYFRVTNAMRNCFPFEIARSSISFPFFSRNDVYKVRVKKDKD